MRSSQFDARGEKWSKKKVRGGMGCLEEGSGLVPHREGLSTDLYESTKSWRVKPGQILRRTSLSFDIVLHFLR